MNKEFLPVGSVVILKGGTKRVMVTGFCSIDNDDKSKMYDYTGCLYPEGIINSNEICLFTPSTSTWRDGKIKKKLNLKIHLIIQYKNTIIKIIL